LSSKRSRASAAAVSACWLGSALAAIAAAARLWLLLKVCLLRASRRCAVLPLLLLERCRLWCVAAAGPVKRPIF
jgi:hypothetical protein